MAPLAISRKALEPGHEMRPNAAGPTPRQARAAEMLGVGRQIASREVGGLGAGRHMVVLGCAGMEAGVYFVRLSREGVDLTRRVVFVR